MSIQLTAHTLGSDHTTERYLLVLNVRWPCVCVLQLSARHHSYPHILPLAHMPPLGLRRHSNSLCTIDWVPVARVKFSARPDVPVLSHRLPEVHRRWGSAAMPSVSMPARTCAGSSADPSCGGRSSPTGTQHNAAARPRGLNTREQTALQLVLNTDGPGSTEA